MFNTWIAALTKPKETFAKEKANASLMNGAKNFAIAGIFASILGTVIAMLFSKSLLGAAIVGIIGLLVGIILNLIMYPIIFIIGIGVLHLIAKLLGGKGSFATDYYLVSTYTPLLAPLLVAALLIPKAGIFIYVLIVIYQLYLLTFALKESHEFSTGKAALTWLIPGILVALLVILLVVVAGVAVLGGIAAAGLGHAATPTPVV